MSCKPAPYSTDQKAIIERENCDYNEKVTIEMAESGNVNRKVRIYCDGIYDLFHQGHARQMMQAKNIFPKCEVYLIVGCCNDEMTHAKKGVTVLTDTERYEAIRHCRYVDEVLKDAPWMITEKFLQANKIDFVAQDSTPYVSDGNDIYKMVKDKNMFVPTQRTDGISTSDILKRIIKNHDIYVHRNLMRGISAKEMNISILTEKKFQMKEKYAQLRENFAQIFHLVSTYFGTGTKQPITTDIDGKLIDTTMIDIDASLIANQH
jgi:choline-phosphate cytidylyltransferase